MDTPEQAIIEVTIPLHYCTSPEDYPSDCAICMHPMCTSACQRFKTSTSCCTQPVCAGCLSKTTQRCRCHGGCKNVISVCPFCREICQVDALTMYHANRTICVHCNMKKDLFS